MCPVHSFLLHTIRLSLSSYAKISTHHYPYHSTQYTSNTSLFPLQIKHNLPMPSYQGILPHFPSSFFSITKILAITSLIKPPSSHFYCQSDVPASSPAAYQNLISHTSPKIPTTHFLHYQIIIHNHHPINTSSLSPLAFLHQHNPSQSPFSFFLSEPLNPSYHIHWIKPPLPHFRCQSDPQTYSVFLLHTIRFITLPHPSKSLSTTLLNIPATHTHPKSSISSCPFSSPQTNVLAITVTAV